MSSEVSSSSSITTNRPHATLAFDIEGSGGLRVKNQMLSWGWCLEEDDGTQNKGQVALYLGKLENESWGVFWERNGWDMDCFNGFWSKNLDKLVPLQLFAHDHGVGEESEHMLTHKDTTVTKCWRFTRFSEFLQCCESYCVPKDVVVVEASNYKENKYNQVLWLSKEYDDLRKKISPIFYIRAYTERQLAFVIHDVLKELQSRYKITYVSDTLHYDASWTDMLLEKYGFPPLLYDQSGDMSYKRMCWGRELGSFVMGMSATDNRTESKEQYTKTKRWIEDRVSNGWDEKNSHFAVDDALKINGSWEEVERENRRRFKLHQRIAHSIREKEEGETVKDAEKRDPRPNWAHFYNFIDDNLTDLCEMAEKHRDAKRQKRA